MRIPSPQEIRALHEKHAPTPEAFEVVHGHCEIVWAVAEQLLSAGSPAARRLDAELVRAGCLLHDIGVYRLYGPDGTLDHARYIQHGVLGHGLLREAGFPEEICRFCSCHTGMGLTREDIESQGLPVPLDDFVPETGEEELVMYADKFHSKTAPPVFLTPDTAAARLGRFGQGKVDRFQALRDAFGTPDVTGFARSSGQRLI